MIPCSIYNTAGYYYIMVLHCTWGRLLVLYDTCRILAPTAGPWLLPIDFLGVQIQGCLSLLRRVRSCSFSLLRISL